MEHKPFVITIVGPESSGKTTLARELASHFGCPWVPEYAREYLEGLGRTYTVHDLIAIAEGQLERISRELVSLHSPLGPLKGVTSESDLRTSPLGSLKGVPSESNSPLGELKEDLSESSSPLGSLKGVPSESSSPLGPLKGVPSELFYLDSLNERVTNGLTFYREEVVDERRPVLVVDSGMLNLRMWARIKYGVTIPLVEEALKEDVTSMYILCRPLREWEADPLREAPLLVDRAWIYNQYLLELVTNLGK